MKRLRRPSPDEACCRIGKFCICNSLLDKGLYLVCNGTSYAGSVSEFVERLAQAYGVQYRRSGLDDFAEAVTRAAGDEVELDLTGKLLVALKKQDRINGRQFARLMANHIREIKRVRPIRGLRNQGLPA